MQFSVLIENSAMKWDEKYPSRFCNHVHAEMFSFVVASFWHCILYHIQSWKIVRAHNKSYSLVCIFFRCVSMIAKYSCGNFYSFKQRISVFFFSRLELAYTRQTDAIYWFLCVQNDCVDFIRFNGIVWILYGWFGENICGRCWFVCN